ncbi:arylsulfatase [Rubinisphaera italica]|uniref:Arylsulfatase n=1 Tax=Rubinisphaera italica TaxID=2527969 RepID=A0A5C5XC86_9PLAN|nr:arylsulfatase [Rubinisphaera italica]TWT59532.1 Arylsulfatase [Rubinisphaera italica]
MNRWKLCLTIAAGILLGVHSKEFLNADERPNIVIILVDDMGFSDVGCYGSEISTPNLDRLAENGLRFTQFYNTGRCCPTRAALLTGLYSHQAGIGHMNQDKGDKRPGYRGHLLKRCVTIGEVLRPAGYLTAVTGKWHVGASDHSWWPLQRGFDRFYGVPQGGGFYFAPTKGRDLVAGNDIQFSFGDKMPEGFYTTDAFAEQGNEFVKEAVKQEKPFFWYLAFNAPHWPLQADQKDIEKYKGKYLEGWEATRKARHQKQIELGLIDEAWDLTPQDPEGVKWSQLDQSSQEKQDLGMACYAAVMERMDHAVGKVVASLEEQGVLDNTLILFLSDNGGCAEGGDLVKNSGTPEAAWGSADSFIRYGKAWSNVSNTPFRKHKHWNHEGGIASPLIAHWPKGIPQHREGTFCRQPAHVIDLMATCADLGQAKYPKNFYGNEIVPLAGKSLKPLLSGREQRIHEVIFWEHEGNRAVRKGDWKLVANGPKGKWELYDMQNDRTEMHNLAGEKPAKVKELISDWEEWAKESYVLPWIWKPGYMKARAEHVSQ